MRRSVLAVPGTVVPSAAWTTCTGSGAPPASRSPNGTPSAVASDERVSIVGLPRPASSAESVAFAIPLARASSDRLRPCSPRRRRRLAATTGMRSFIMSNERTNESNGNTASGARRGPGHRPLRRGRRAPSGSPSACSPATRASAALKAVVFSATTFAGSAQFAATSVLSAGGTLAAAIAAAVLLNTRYIPIGLSVAPSLRGPAWKRGLRAQLVVDESWAVSHLGGGRYDPRLLLGAGLTLYCAWVAGTTVGSVAGSLLGDPETLGLDAAFPALFLALLAGQVRGRTGVVAALGGAVVAAALVPFVPPGVPVVAASVVCLIGLRRPAGEAPS